MRALEPNLKMSTDRGEGIWSAMALSLSSETYTPVRKQSTHPPAPPKQCWNGHWGQRSGSQLCEGGAEGEGVLSFRTGV